MLLDLTHASRVVVFDAKPILEIDNKSIIVLSIIHNSRSTPVDPAGGYRYRTSIKPCMSATRLLVAAKG